MRSRAEQVFELSTITRNRICVRGASRHLPTDELRVRTTDSLPVPTYSGMLPCLRFGWATRFDCSIRSALISLGRVWRGSMTSSM
jgi:hypothetical protein